MVWGEDGWLRTVAGDGLPSVETEAPRAAAQAAAPSAGPRELRRRAAADRFSVAAIAVARRVVQSDRAAGIPAALRTRNGGQPVQAGPRRAPAAVALLQRVDDRRVRAAALPADGGARLLLQQLQVPLPVCLDGRRRRQARSGDVGAAGPGAGGRVHALLSRFRRMLPSNCASRSKTSVFISGIASAVPNGRGFRSSSMRASSPTKPRCRGCRTSRAPSSAWRARTCPARGVHADFDWFEYVERPYRVDPFET